MTLFVAGGDLASNFSTSRPMRAGIPDRNPEGGTCDQTKVDTGRCLMEDRSIGARSAPPTESTLPAVLANLEHAVPTAPLVKVNAASRRVRTCAPGTVNPPSPSALPAGLKRGLSLGPGRFLLSGPIALLTRDLLVSAALWAKLHRSRAALAVETIRRRFGATSEWRSQRRAPQSGSTTAQSHYGQMFRLRVCTG